MLAKVVSCAVVGLEGALVQVEVDHNPRGLTSITLVGLPDAAVRESTDRVLTAIKNSGARFPDHRVTINLAPADLRKEGPAYDLPIAIGALLASEAILADVSDALFVGELSLDGSVRHTNGILPMVATARDKGLKNAYVPEADAAEAALIPGLTVYPVANLGQLIGHLNGIERIPPFAHALDPELLSQAAYATDFAVIKGQEHCKRALEVAAAGGHCCLLSGPPGAGKTLLARAVPSIMPSLSIEEALEITKIYSVSGLLPADTPLIVQRPFRAPHHTISHAGLIGGGAWPRPGEVSLGHRGVLFLDELPEFGPRVLEVMRQPLEDKVVTISRAQGTLTFPANFMLIAAMNPCPCGYYGDPTHECHCGLATVSRYQRRISGPLLDRIDIHLDVPRVEYDKLTDDRLGEPSATVRARVEAARKMQHARFGVDAERELRGSSQLRKTARIFTNADMGPAEVREHCRLDDAGKGLLRAAVQQLGMSARAFTRILKLARTIADLEGAEEIRTQHLAEALQYRPRRS